ncbi:hypothetical protein [Vibrio sp. VB16]|uniref:hypothetical protein n=1 Tax=Vibrio sp. VB16 TaxID=2785746 RepID=UPI0018A0E0CF|nr:hypothetical protein [Vibrio sp. VB16]UGA54618.1 hypothetical protein IUZ65_015475 [Vibrio sp. VB16]
MKFNKTTLAMSILAFTFTSGSVYAIDDINADDIGIDNDDISLLSDNNTELLSDNDLQNVGNSDNDQYDSNNDYNAEDFGNVDDVGNVDDSGNVEDSGNTDDSYNDVLSHNTLQSQSWDNDSMTNTATSTIDIDLTAVVNYSDMDSSVSGATVSYGVTDTDADFALFGLEVGGRDRDRNAMSVSQQNNINGSFNAAAGITTAAQNAGNASSIQQSVSTNATIMP